MKVALVLIALLGCKRPVERTGPLVSNAAEITGSLNTLFSRYLSTVRLTK